MSNEARLDGLSPEDLLEDVPEDRETLVAGIVSHIQANIDVIEGNIELILEANPGLTREFVQALIESYKIKIGEIQTNPDIPIEWLQLKYVSIRNEERGDG